MKATFNGAMRIYNSGWCDVSHTNEKEEMVEKFGVPEAEVEKKTRQSQRRTRILFMEIYFVSHVVIFIM